MTSKNYNAQAEQEKIHPKFNNEKMIDDQVVRFLNDQDATDLQSQHIDDLNDTWNHTVNQEHFKKSGLVLTPYSFQNLESNDMLQKILNNPEFLKQISKHPFEWLTLNQSIKLFNILRALDPNIKQLHKVTTDGLRLTILEWQHIHSLLIVSQDSPMLNNSLKDNARTLLELFSVRFAEIKKLDVSDDLITNFCLHKILTDKTWINLRRAKWLLVLMTFLFLGLEMLFGDKFFFKALSLLSMLGAFSIFYYYQYVYPFKYKAEGIKEIICEKLIMESY